MPHHWKSSLAAVLTEALNRTLNVQPVPIDPVWHLAAQLMSMSSLTTASGAPPADVSLAAEKAAAEKAAVERVAVERAAAEQTVAEKSSVEKVAVEEVAVEKAAVEKVTTQQDAAASCEGVVHGGVGVAIGELIAQAAATARHVPPPPLAAPQGAGAPLPIRVGGSPPLPIGAAIAEQAAVACHGSARQVAVADSDAKERRSSIRRRSDAPALYPCDEQPEPSLQLEALPPELKAQLQLIDVDSSGTVEWEEFLAFALPSGVCYD
eukprot:809252-Prymnesium_polylepis.1